jgi:hypothetical protein
MVTRLKGYLKIKFEEKKIASKKDSLVRNQKIIID